MRDPLLLRRLSTRGDRGALTLWAPSATLIIGRVSGFLFEELIPPYIEILDAFTAGKPLVHLMSDWSEMSGYDGQSRKRLTVWQDAHKGVTKPHICVKSAIVAMGVNMANVVLGNQLWVTSHKNELYDVIRGLTPQSTHAALAAFAERNDAGFRVERWDID